MDDNIKILVKVKKEEQKSLSKKKPNDTTETKITVQKKDEGASQTQEKASTATPEVKDENSCVPSVLSFLPTALSAAAHEILAGATRCTIMSVDAASQCLPSTILSSAPEDLVEDAQEMAAEVQETGEAKVEDAKEGAKEAVEGAAEIVEDTTKEAVKTEEAKDEGSKKSQVSSSKGHLPAPLRLFTSMPSMQFTSAPYAFATYVTVAMIYVFGLSLLPYACTHNPEMLYWPLLILFFTGITSVLLRTQLMIRRVPEARRTTTSAKS